VHCVGVCHLVKPISKFGRLRRKWHDKNLDFLWLCTVTV